MPRIFRLSGLSGLRPATLAPLLAAVLAAPFLSAHAGTISFDDPTLAGPIADGYEGFNWLNFGIAAAADYPGTGWASAATSGAQFGYNTAPMFHGNQPAMSFSSASAFNLVSMSLTNFSDNFGAYINGYRNGTLVYSLLAPSNADAATSTVFNWFNIDRVDISLGHTYSLTAVDDIAFTRSASPIPEPATGALLLAGLAAMLALARRPV